MKPQSQKLLSLQTDIDGKEVRFDIYENSSLTEIARNICHHYCIDSACREQVEYLIGERIKKMMEVEDDKRFRRQVQDLLSANKENNQRPTSHERSQEADSSQNLYEKSMRTSESRQIMLRTLKMQQEKEQIEKCTFRPSINSKSHRINRPAAVYEELYKTAKLYDRKKEEKRRDKERKELSQLTFHPELNYCSVRIAEEKRQGSSELRLTTSTSVDKSNEDKNRHQRSMFSFCPEISPGTKRMVRQRQIPNFSKRLEGYLSKLKAKPVVKTINTNQKPTRPIQTASPANARELMDCKKKSITATMYAPISPGHKASSQSLNTLPGATKSGELYNRKKTRVFSMLFESLQEENVVSTDSLQNSNIAADLYCLLLPLIEQIIELKVTLNRNEFLTSIGNFFESLTPGDKDTLLNHETKCKWQNQHDQYRNQYKFKPQLCRKSNELSLESRLNALRTNIVKEYTNNEDMSLVMQEEEMGLSSLDSRDR